MKRSTLILLKTAVWLVCLYPVGRLVYGAITNDLGADPTHTITFATGLATLRLLVISLAITPLRRLFPRLSWLIKFRRLLGLFAFFYGTLHLLTWAALYNGFDVSAMAADFVKRRYITAGITAWVLMVPLAATSTTWAIKKMGGKNWNRLHRLVYLSATAGIVHYWWQVKPGVITPIGMTLVLAILLAARPVLAWRQKQRTRAAVAA